MVEARPSSTAAITGSIPREALFWAAHAGFWVLAFGAGMIVVQAFVPMPRNPALVVAPTVILGGVVTGVIRWLAVHDTWQRRLGVSKAGLTIGGPLAGAVLVTLLLSWLDAPGPQPSPRLGLLARFVINAVLLGSWSAAYFGTLLLNEGRAAELRALEAESLAYRNELRQLQSQISPHFLFNALNTILACKHSPDDIETVTQSLSKYLRFLLTPSDALAPLGREIDALEDYLTIQSFRFGDRLVCRIDCDTDIRRIPVLPAMIQPLVENALKYGRHGDDEPLEVSVRAWRERALLSIEVANTGPWIVPERDGSTNTGLHTLRRRLLLHGGPDATVTTADVGGRVHVLIQIPLAPEYAVPTTDSTPRDSVEIAR